MDFGPSHVPAELLDAIVRMLPVADLKNVRQVCSGLAAIASQFLFQTVYISTQLQDRENLASVSNHAFIRHNVREIIYDSTYMCSTEPLDRDRLIKANYKRLFWNGGFRLADADYTKAAIERGFNRYQAGLQDQVNLAEYCGAHLTKLVNSDTLPNNFPALLEDPKYHAAMAVYLPDDLVRLVEALPKMPNVRRFAVSDCRHTSNDKHYRFSYFAEADIEGIPDITFSIRNKGIRGLDAVVLDPRPWPEPMEEEDPDSDRSWYRGFSVLMQAASMTNMKRLESFNVESNHDLCGLSHSILDMSSSELRHATNAFGNLKTIKLWIDSRPVIDRRPGMAGYPATFHVWSQTLESKSIAVVLSAAIHLETLELGFEDAVCDTPCEVTSFANLVGTGTWPRLRSLRLGHMVMHENEFLDFFKRHSQTLQSLWLQQVALFSARASQHGEHRPAHGSWGSTFRSMATNNLALTSFGMHFHVLGGWDISNAECIKHHAHGATEVLEFFQSGGTDQKKKLCGH